MFDIIQRLFELSAQIERAQHRVLPDVDYLPDLIGEIHGYEAEVERLMDVLAYAVLGNLTSEYQHYLNQLPKQTKQWLCAPKTAVR